MIAETGGPPQTPGLEARVARLEADVAHMREDIGEINRLAPLFDKFRSLMAAALPTLATKRKVTELQAEMKTDIADLRQS